MRSLGLKAPAHQQEHHKPKLDGVFSSPVEGAAPNGEIGSFVVLSVANYWGYHRKELWEWLKAKSE
jgi:hypothetical protein